MVNLIIYHSLSGKRVKMSKNTDKVNCPYCGTPQEIKLDSDRIECKHCGYEIILGKKVLPFSNNPFA